MDWSGEERRKEGGGHDLLIRIDANLSNLIENVDKHVKADEKGFSEHDTRLSRLEMWGAMAAGGLAVLEVLLSMYRHGR